MTLLTLFLAVIVGTQAAQPASPAPVRASSRDYTIGARDVLTITVFGEPDVSGRYTVDSAGTLDFRWIGRIRAEGLTLRQLEDLLVKRLKEGYLVDPQVSVDVEQYRSQSVYVMGEVRTPGAVSITGEMRLLDVLGKAGSLTPAAGSMITITRPRGPRSVDGPMLPGSSADVEVIHVNVKDLHSGVSGQEITLRDGDTIYVPKAATFYVTGYVRTPGPYTLDADTTVLQALSLAGGVNERGAGNRVRITRIVNGKTVEIRPKLTDLVQPGDTIYVPQRYF
jgi:polysaccharide export outer membrane protein